MLGFKKIEQTGETLIFTCTHVSGFKHAYPDEHLKCKSVYESALCVIVLVLCQGSLGWWIGFLSKTAKE